jgi:hypothetical protein
MDFLRLLRPGGEAKRKEHGAKHQRRDYFLHRLFTRSTRHTIVDTRPFLFDHFVRSRQHIRRNREADQLGRFEIDDELKLHRLLHR